tara:strand:+ start:432 stop:623 length:192 start_codon:yes stop_codon:yes gene_type:complete
MFSEFFVSEFKRRLIFLIVRNKQTQIMGRQTINAMSRIIPIMLKIFDSITLFYRSTIKKHPTK